MEKIGKKHWILNTSPRHPWANGKTENVHNLLKYTTRKIMKSNLKIPGHRAIQFAAHYHNAFSGSTATQFFSALWERRQQFTSEESRTVLTLMVQSVSVSFMSYKKTTQLKKSKMGERKIIQMSQLTHLQKSTIDYWFKSILLMDSILNSMVIEKSSSLIQTAKPS